MFIRKISFIFLIYSLVFSACDGEAGFYKSNNKDADIDVPDDTTDTTDVPDEVDSDGDSTHVPVCGDGVAEGDEVCDDGNNISGDGCNASCSLNDSFDFVANSRTPGDQSYPVILGNSSEDSTFVLLYTDWGGGDGSKAGIFASFYAADGRFLFEKTINQIIGGNQFEQAGYVSEDNKLFAVWNNEFEGNNAHLGIRGILTDMNGDILVSEFQVDTSFEAEDITPSVSCNETMNRCFVVWADTSGSDGADLKGRFFDLDGNPLVNTVNSDENEFEISVPSSSGLQINPKIYKFISDRWLLLYEDYSGDTDSSPPGIKLLVLNATGETESSMTVNSITSDKQVYPVASVSDSGVVVCWTDDSHFSDQWVWGISCRIFSLSLSPVTDDFGVNEIVKSSQLNPQILMLDDDFLVFWEDWSASDGNGAGIKARKISWDGSFVSGEFQINTTYMGHQITPSALRRGDLAFFAWSDGSGNPPDDWGTSVRMLLRRITTLSD